MDKERMLQARLNAALHEIGRLRLLLESKERDKSRPNPPAPRELEARDFSDAVHRQPPLPALDSALGPSENRDALRALRFELQHALRERDAALEKLETIASTAADNARLNERCNRDILRVQAVVERRVDALLEILDAVAVILPSNGASSVHLSRLIDGAHCELDALLASVVKEVTTPQDQHLVAPNLVYSERHPEESAAAINAESDEGDAWTRRPSSRIQILRPLNQRSRRTERSDRSHAENGVSTTASYHSSAAPLRSISRAAARIAQARRGLAQLSGTDDPPQPRPRSAPATGFSHATAPLQSFDVQVPDTTKTAAASVRSTLTVLVGDMTRENTRLRQRLSQLQCTIEAMQQHSALDHEAQDGAAILRTALAAARGAQLELERQLHDARGDAARSQSDAQAAFEASRHANRCRDEAEARAASLEGQLLACQRDAARMKAEVQAIRRHVAHGNAMTAQSNVMQLQHQSVEGPMPQSLASRRSRVLEPALNGNHPTISTDSKKGSAIRSLPARKPPGARSSSNTSAASSSESTSDSRPDEERVATSRALAEPVVGPRSMTSRSVRFSAAASAAARQRAPGHPQPVPSSSSSNVDLATAECNDDGFDREMNLVTQALAQHVALSRRVRQRHVTQKGPPCEEPADLVDRSSIPRHTESPCNADIATRARPSSFAAHTATQTTQTNLQRSTSASQHQTRLSGVDILSPVPQAASKDHTISSTESIEIHSAPADKGTGSSSSSSSSDLMTSVSRLLAQGSHLPSVSPGRWHRTLAGVASSSSERSAVQYDVADDLILKARTSLLNRVTEPAASLSFEQAVADESAAWPPPDVNLHARGEVASNAPDGFAAINGSGEYEWDLWRNLHQQQTRRLHAVDDNESANLSEERWSLRRVTVPEPGISGREADTTLAAAPRLGDPRRASLTLSPDTVRPGRMQRQPNHVREAPSSFVSPTSSESPASRSLVAAHKMTAVTEPVDGNGSHSSGSSSSQGHAVLQVREQLRSLDGEISSMQEAIARASVALDWRTPHTTTRADVSEVLELADEITTARDEFSIDVSSVV